MGDFTSRYKDQDGRITTRIDAVKTIDKTAEASSIIIVAFFYGIWKLVKYLFTERGNRKVVSIVLAIIGGGIGLNNFYNKRYIIGLLKLVLFGFSALVAVNASRHTNDIGIMIIQIMPALVIIGWIEAFFYLFMSGDKFTKKENSKSKEQTKKNETPSYTVEKQNIIDEMKEKGFSFNHKLNIFTSNNSPVSCKLIDNNGEYSVSEAY